MRTPTAIRTAALTGVAALVVGVAAPSAPAASRTCGTVGNDSDTGGAEKIIAVDASCATARQVARSCMRGKRSGYRASTTSLGRVALTKGRVRISFMLVGGTIGCTR